MHKLKNTRLVIFLLLCFSFNLNAQTVDETLEYIRNSSAVYVESLSGNTISFAISSRSAPFSQGGDFNADRYLISADLSKVNFRLASPSLAFMYSDLKNKSIKKYCTYYIFWDDSKKKETDLGKGKTDYLCSYDLPFKYNEPKAAGLVKAFKHLQKLLGCENNAQDQRLIDDKVKDAFEKP